MIGIYGGTFDPIHYGHLRTALEMKEVFALDQLRLIPCQIPPHRDRPSVAAEQRWELLQRALANTPEFIADRRELDRNGPSYTVDTLTSLREEYPNQPLLLFIGTDAFAGLERWHCWQQLFDHAHVVVMARPGFNVALQNDFLRTRLTDHPSELQQRHGRLYFQTVTQLEISATQIRNLIATGRNPRFLLPDAVVAYIQHHRLYRN